MTQRSPTNRRLFDAWTFPKICSFLQQLAGLIGRLLAVSADSVEQTGADGLARVHCHNRSSAILVKQEVMAAFHAKNAKVYPFCGITGHHSSEWWPPSAK